jgi:glycosyltransferase involved in cell wall biosynthesis
MSLTASPYEILFDHCNPSNADAAVSVIITCYKYGMVGLEALASLLQQTEFSFDVILIDDQSPDDSVNQLLPWFQQHAAHPNFRRLLFIRHIENQGLSKARNTAISIATTPYVFILDADNLLYPDALKALRNAMDLSGADMAYSLIEVFGGRSDIVGNSVWMPEKFAKGNYIDAMAMIKTQVVCELAGYRVMPNKFGWEDYDFWCKLVDHGLRGCHVPQILCRYRAHAQSMVNTETRDFLVNKMKFAKEDFEKHHTFKFRWEIL